MRMFRLLTVAACGVLLLAGAALSADPSWPKEVTFALLSTENAAEITRRWGPILAQLEKDLGVKVKSATATDYRGSIEALKFKKAEIGHLGPKSYVEASNNNYANVEPVAQLRLANGSLGYRSCLIVPIRLHGELIGLLNFCSFTVARFVPADALPARRVADHIEARCGYGYRCVHVTRAGTRRTRRRTFRSVLVRHPGLRAGDRDAGVPCLRPDGGGRCR